MAAVAAGVAIAGAMLCWDAAQLLGPQGPQHRRALAALALHPLETLREQRESGRRASAIRALWIRDGRVRSDDAQALLTTLAKAEADGVRLPLRTAELRRQVLAAEAGDASALRRLPDRLSDAVTGYAAALSTPAPGVRTIFADPSVTPATPSAGVVLDEAVKAPSLAAFLERLSDGNPLARGLRRALDACHARGAACDPAQEGLLLANYQRARALPADLGARYILVNVPEQKLWMVDHGRAVDSMPVVVGKLSEPTPELAAVVRRALYNPYWNVPPDLTRDGIASPVLRHGVGYLARQHLQVLSDWTPAAHPVDPASVDWAAAAAGATPLHLRQLPGPDNMMGAVKFELPNALGIYLHDTPHRDAFDRSVRAESSGCVRLQDALRLARWLMGPKARPPSSEAEVGVDIRPGVPVYITYLTARVEDGRIVRSADLYGRDGPLIAALSGKAQEPAGAQAQ